MVYNPKYHRRKSIRLKGYDYSSPGLYFVTICCQKRACLFGEVKKGIMVLNDSGKMIKKWYYELENKFHDIKCHEMIHHQIEMIRHWMKMFQYRANTSRIWANT